jgi:hypothetical protein
MTKLYSSVKIRTYKVPPSNFDIDSASDSERVAYGFPRLPAAAASLQALWEVKAKHYRLVVPTFKPRTTRRVSFPKLKLDHTAERNSIWSGVITTPPVGDTMQWVKGTWSMPTIQLPPDAKDGGRYCASTWVGIDGDDGSQDVLQAGCDADVSLSGGVTQYQYLPWWQWYPGGTFWITNMPVSPGDLLDCLISLQAGSTTTASIFLGNKTTNVGLTFSAEAPEGASLAGNCAEWIIEAFGLLGPLARYSPVDFTNCNAGTVKGQTVSAGTGTTINMVDTNGNVVSSGQIINPTDVRVVYI